MWGRLCILVTVAAFRLSAGLPARAPDPQAPQKADPLAMWTSLPKIVLLLRFKMQSEWCFFLALCCANVRHTETTEGVKVATCPQLAGPPPPWNPRHHTHHLPRFHRQLRRPGS